MQKTVLQPESSKAFVHDLNVAPVVMISSTNKTFFSFSLAEFPKNASSKFLNLSSRVRSIWDVVSFTLDTESKTNGSDKDRDNG